MNSNNTGLFQQSTMIAPHNKTTNHYGSKSETYNQNQHQDYYQRNKNIISSSQNNNIITNTYNPNPYSLNVARRDAQSRDMYQVSRINNQQSSIKSQNAYSYNQLQQFKDVTSSSSEITKPLQKGLQNLGNTCYMYRTLQYIYYERNATLQSLLSLDAFTFYLHANAFEPAKQPITMALKKLKSLLDEHTYVKAVSPYHFKDTFGSIYTQFKGHGQEDAHEFLVFLLDGLSQELNQPQKLKELGFFENIFSYDQPKKSIEAQAEIQWLQYRSQSKSIITDLIYGQHYNLIKCQNCMEEIINFQQFSALNLPINYRNQDENLRLENLLQQYEGLEIIQDGYSCEKCRNKNASSMQQTGTWRLPQILIIQLKRFDQRGSRVNVKIQFPLKNLDLNKHMQLTFYNGCIENLDYNYDLQCIIHHMGTCQNGHYYATCRVGEKWYRYDDSDVSEVQLENKQYDTFGSTTPYMLIYQKKRIV